MLEHSPLALRLLKAGYNAGIDGLAGMQQLAGDATLLYYMSEEAQEGRDAFMEKRAARLLAVPEAPVTRPCATWWRGARPRTLGAGVVPVLVGVAPRPVIVVVVAPRRGAARRGRAAGRRELRERLLRRRAGRRHRRPGRAAAAHRRREPPRRARCSSPRWLRSRSPAFAGLALAHRDESGADPRRRRARDRRGPAVQRRAASVRRTRARRADGVRVLRAWSRRAARPT